MHGLVLDQLLSISQVSHCTDEGGASVYLVASYLAVRVDHTFNLCYY